MNFVSQNPITSFWLLVIACFLLGVLAGFFFWHSYRDDVAKANLENENLTTQLRNLRVANAEFARKSRN